MSHGAGGGIETVFNWTDDPEKHGEQPVHSYMCIAMKHNNSFKSTPLRGET